jgi:hypothetical protein
MSGSELERVLIGVALLLAIGAVAVLVVALRRRGSWLRHVSALTLAAGAFVAWEASKVPSAVIDGLTDAAKKFAVNRVELMAALPTPSFDDGYVGSESCRSCHTEEHASWDRSHHRRMTTPAITENVLAPFDGKEVVRGGRSYRFIDEPDAYYVEMVDPVYDWDQRGGVRDPSRDAAEPPVRAKKRVVMVTGSHHQQVFWVAGALPNQLDYVPLVWVIAEKEWRPIRDIFVTHGARPEYLRLWNDHCIHCHSTDGVPRPVKQEGGGWARETSAAELGIACESCHGPGKAHVDAREAEKAAGGAAASGGAAKSDPTIANPKTMPAARSSETCGLCHAVTHSVDQERWYREGFVFRPGQELGKTEIVLRPFDPAHAAYVAEREKGDPDFVRNGWWSDGEIRVSGREHSALDASPCFTKGTLSCTSCHSMHGYVSTDDQLKRGMDGDAACTQCHAEPKYAPERHAKHAPSSEGARCQNCHTPHTTYGLQKAIRTHRVSSPSVATTLATGRPNACNLCHLDKTLAWTQDALVRDFGAKPVEIPEPRRDVSDWAWHLVAGDAGVRALAGWHAGWAPAKVAAGEDFLARATPLLLEAFAEDEYSAVRFQARRTLGLDALKDDLAPIDVRRKLAEAFDAARKKPAGGARPDLLLGADGRIERPAYLRVKSLRDDRKLDLTE